VSRIHVQPLRERREDIPLLIAHFLARRQQETGKQGLWLSYETCALMFDYHWPGNVRQVKSVVYRLVASAGNSELIGPERFLKENEGAAPPPSAVTVEDKFIIDARLSHHERLNELERQSILRVLNETGDNITQAAKTLGMSRNGLKNRIERLEIKITNHC